jgi:hypothetical protein
MLILREWEEILVLEEKALIVGTDYFWEKALAAASTKISSGAFAGPLAAADLTLRLFANNWPLNNKTTLADLIEATFDGYAAISPMVYLTEYQLPSFAWVLETQINQFLMTGSTTPNTIYGWSLETAHDSIQLLMCELFAAPIPMTAANQSINLALQVQMGDPANLLGMGRLN